MQEKELIALLKKRDEKGIKELLLHYGPLMRYIIAPILLNPQDREDCLSEITMRIWEKIDTFDENRGKWNSWLTALTRNTALNKARDDKKHHSNTEVGEEIPTKELTPEEYVLRIERMALLKKALSELEKKEQQLFYRKYYYMQSTKQIASEMGMTERAVEGKLYRLRQKLKNKLGGEVYE